MKVLIHFIQVCDRRSVYSTAMSMLCEHSDMNPTMFLAEKTEDGL